MKIRGTRKCRDCGRRWSYYETGSVACPSCGGMVSVGTDERTLHTAGSPDLDLSSHRAAIADGSIEEAAPELRSALREYVRERGFVDAGDLRRLDDAFLAAHELRHALDVYVRERDPADDARLYVLELVGALDVGERPGPDAVPPTLTAARGLGVATAIDEYRREVLEWLAENGDPPGRRVLGTVAERVKRVEALQGEVPPREVEALVDAVREVTQYLHTGEERALAAAERRLEALE